MLQGHGDDVHFFNDIIANFSTNVWYKSNFEKLAAYIRDNLSIIKNYPEVSAESLKELLSKHHNINQSQIIITNGATEAIYLISQTYNSKKSTILCPTFAEYEDSSKINNHKILYKKWDDLDKNSIFNSDLVWICNPNNPTGDILKKNDLDTLILANQNSLFIIDEAYIDFTTEISSITENINNYNNVIIIKSLTKNFAIPGLRLGYIISSTNLIEKLTLFKSPWSVNSIAILAGKFILNNLKDFKIPLTTYLKSAHDFKEMINKLDYFEVVQSNTTFFLVKLLKGNSKDLKNYLANTFKILIRDASNFRGLNSSYIRLATQSKEKNLLLIKALKEWSTHI